MYFLAERGLPSHVAGLRRFEASIAHRFMWGEEFGFLTIARISDPCACRRAQIANPMFALKGPLMAQNKFPTAFPLKHAQKDLRLALLEADNAGISVRISP